MSIKPVAGEIKAQDINDNLSYLDGRVNNIISTPADGISEEEIYDAREGKQVLGDRIRAIASGQDLEPKAVTNDKLRNAVIGKNLFDRSTAQFLLISMSTGMAEPNNNYYSSDYMLIEPNTTYRTRYQCRVIFYDDNRNFISSSGIVNPAPELGGRMPPVESPSNARYARISFRSSNIEMLNSFQFEIGTERTNPEPYYHLLKNTVSLDESRVKAQNSIFEYDENGDLISVSENNVITMFYYNEQGISHIIIVDNELLSQKRIDFVYEDGYVKQVTERFL